MSPRRSSLSAWGLSPESDNSTRNFAVAGVAILLVGVLLGWVVRGGSSESSDNKPTVDESTIAIERDALLVASYGQTENGAAKAATSFITGLPLLALQTKAERDKAIESLLAPNASSQLVNNVGAALNEIRTRLTGNISAGQAPTVRLVLSPLTYKVTMTNPATADVSLWYVSVGINANGETVQALWATGKFKLSWSDHWRISDFVSFPGPTPQIYSQNAEPSTYADVAEAFNQTKAFKSALN